jgi:hypothetical protein
VRALVERVGPDSAGDQATQVCGVEQHLRANGVGDLADGGDRVRGEVQAAPDGDQLRLEGPGQLGERVDIHRVGGRVDRGTDAPESVKAGGASLVVSDMPGD